MLSINENNLQALFATFSKDADLYIPVDHNENGKSAADFHLWKEGMKLSSALNTVKSAKDFFFPQVENLVDFKMKGKDIEIIEKEFTDRPFIVFGMKGCDVKALDVLDKVFLAEPEDSFYKNRRDNGIIVSLACEKPGSSCFCMNFGNDPANPSGDVTCWKAGDTFYFQSNTDKGKKLLEKVSSLLEEKDDSEVENQKKSIAERVKKLPFANLNLDVFKKNDMMDLFNSDKWNDLSQACLGCGACTFVCPTCQCFDIKDFNTGKKVIRFRCWDSCMYSEFTKMAAANPRHTQKERFRQRFMHKLVYSPKNNDGLMGCVGCGRCISTCPQSMNIVKVIKEFQEENNE